MSLTTVRVTIDKPARTKVDGGGRAIAYTPVPGTWDATRNYYGKLRQLLQLEQAAHNSEGPDKGENRKLQLFVFRPPFPPDIGQQYRILADDGVKYTVLFVRKYETTMQVDAEVIG
jgi:hypothetical protein